MSRCPSVSGLLGVPGISGVSGISSVPGVSGIAGVPGVSGVQCLCVFQVHHPEDETVFT